MTNRLQRYGTNAGHGHVWARPDGVKVRCGGPGLCKECSRDQKLIKVCEPFKRTDEDKIVYTQPSGIHPWHCNAGKRIERAPRLDEHDGDYE